MIITADSDSGMVDIHDRNLLCYPPILKPGLSSEEAELIIRELGELAAKFKWHPVKHDVGNVRNEGPDLIEAVVQASGEG